MRPTTTQKTADVLHSDLAQARSLPDNPAQCVEDNGN